MKRSRRLRAMCRDRVVHGSARAEVEASPRAARDASFRLLACKRRTTITAPSHYPHLEATP